MSGTDPRGTDVIVALRVPTMPDVNLLGSVSAGAAAGVGFGMGLLGRAVALVGNVLAPPTNAVLDATVPGVSQAVVERIDLGAIVTRALDAINLTELVVERVDIRAIVIRALDDLDLTAIVLERVDLKPIVVRALDELDLTSIVLERVDLDPIVTRALDGMDITEVVLERADLERIVTHALDRMDLTQIVVERVDMEQVIDQVPIVEIADYVIEEIDLPRIIRDSTGGIASDAMDSVRLTSYSADRSVGRIVDRLLSRRTRDVDAPGDPESLMAGEAASTEMGTSDRSAEGVNT